MKEDFYTIGKDIINNVSMGPRSCRMGDIYHKIKQTVDKLKKHKITPQRKNPLKARNDAGLSFK